MSKICLLAEFVLKPGSLEELMPVLKDLVNGSRAEDGNISYDLAHDPKNPDRLIVIEKWISDKAIEEHNASPHFQNFLKAVEGKTEKQAISTLRQIM